MGGVGVDGWDGEWMGLEEWVWNGSVWSSGCGCECILVGDVYW